MSAQSSTPRLLLSVVGVVTLFSAGCNYHRDKVGASATTEIPPVSQLSLDFATVQQYVLQPYCVQCHSTARPGSPRLIDYTDVFALVDLQTPANSELLQTLQQSGGRMPLGMPAIPNRAVDLLRAWIEAGAPQNFSTPPPPPSPVSPEPEVPTPSPPPPPAATDTFRAVQSNLLQVYCIQCHGAGGVPPGLTDYDSLWSDPDYPELVVRGAPQESDLYRIVTGPRPRMPRRLPGESGPRVVPPEVLQGLADWIKKGAPND